MNLAKVAVLAALNRLLPQRIKRMIVHTAFHAARPELVDFLHAAAPFLSKYDNRLRSLAVRGLQPDPSPSP
jgi:hypothetical protein